VCESSGESYTSALAADYLALDGSLMAVPIRSGPTFETGVPVPLFGTRVTAARPGWHRAHRELHPSRAGGARRTWPRIEVEPLRVSAVERTRQRINER
jgi:hypothetical protein